MDFPVCALRYSYSASYTGRELYLALSIGWLGKNISGALIQTRLRTQNEASPEQRLADRKYLADVTQSLT